MLKKLSVTALSALLVACGSTNKAIDGQPEKTNNVILKDGSELTVKYIFSDMRYGIRNNKDLIENLTIIKPSHKASAVAGYSLLNVMSTVGILALLDGPKIHTFKREQLSGYKTEIKNIAETYAYHKYISLLKDKLELPRKIDAVDDIAIYPNRFYLMYEDDDSYTLNVGFKIYLERTRVDRMFTCNEKVMGKTFEQWSENNYKLITTEAQKAVDKCFTKLDSSYFEKLSNALTRSDQMY